MKYALLLVLLAGCDPGPPLPCDYCHALRDGVGRYVCDKCKMTHTACDVDKAVMHYEEGTTIRGRASYSATGVITCPSPGDPVHDLVIVQPPPHKNWPPPPGTIGTVISGVVAFFLGYKLGRGDEKRRFMKGRS